MQRFAPVVFAVALGQAALVPLPLIAQHRTDVAVGVMTADLNDESRQAAESSERLSPRLWPDADSTAKKLSLGRHLLVGAGIGLVAGLAIATYGAYRQADSGNENMMPFVVPALGAATGAVLGAVTGWFVYLDRTSRPSH